MRYIVEETLLPWIPSGAPSNYYIAENFEEMRKIVSILLERAKKAFGFTEEEIEDTEMWENETDEGYLETYLKEDKPYQNWAVVWHPETEMNE